MTARYDADRQLSAWLHDIAPAREPEHLLDTVLARTARTRRRPAWRIPERWFSMSAITTRISPAPQLPWRLIALAALLTALLVAALIIAGSRRSPAPPYGLAANGSFFYSENGDLYSQAGLGGARVPIVTGATTDDSPVLSLDGTRLTFLRHLSDSATEIWVVNSDGSDQRKLDIGGTRPGWFEWAPDGRSAVVIEDAHPFQLNISSLAGPPNVYELPVSIEGPVFRPGHDSQVVFMGTAPGGERGIYLVGKDGTGLRRLELDPGFQSDPAYGTDKWAYFSQMSWSPTGDRVLYTSIEPAPDSAAGAGWRLHLATVDAAGAVTDDRLLEFDPATDDEFAPAWLPTGEGFVFENLEGTLHWLASVTLGPSGLGDPRRLQVSGNDWLGAQVSPDGLFILSRLPAAGGTAQVVLVDLATGVPERLNAGADVSWQRLPR